MWGGRRPREPEDMNSTRRAVTASFTLVLLTSGLAACGGQPAVCDDVDALQESVETLTNAPAGEDGLDTVKTELEELQTELQQLADDAATQYATQIDRLNAGVSGLQSSLDTAVDAPSAATLSSLRDDVRAVASAVSDLSTAVADTC
jgi:hypothetical protein